MKTIHKYQIRGTDHQAIEVSGVMVTKLLSVALNPQGWPCIWAEVETDMPNHHKEHILTYIVPTGGVPPVDVDFLGTVVDCVSVWHVYAKRVVSGG